MLMYLESHDHQGRLRGYFNKDTWACRQKASGPDFLVGNGTVLSSGQITEKVTTFSVISNWEHLYLGCLLRLLLLWLLWSYFFSETQGTITLYLTYSYHFFLLQT